MSFESEENLSVMKKAIENCISKPSQYPFVNHSSPKEEMFLTAEYLKASLIIIPTV